MIDEEKFIKLSDEMFEYLCEFTKTHELSKLEMLLLINTMKLSIEHELLE